MRAILSRLIGFFLLLSALMTGIALAKPVVALTLTGAYVERAADGAVHLQPIHSAQAKPGDRIRWEINAANTGNTPAVALVPVGKVPPGTTFVAGSASSGGRVEYSLDNGKTWSPSPTVVIQTPEGPKTQKADPSSYTRVRWVAASALKPGTAAHFTYEVVVK